MWSWSILVAFEAIVDQIDQDARKPEVELLNNSSLERKQLIQNGARTVIL